MRNIHLEKVANNAFEITLPNDAVECVLTDGRLDMASVVAAVPKNSTLIVRHESNQITDSKYLLGSRPAANFCRVAYVLSGNEASLTNELHHVEALRDLYPSVESFDNYNDALAWSIRQNNG